MSTDGYRESAESGVDLLCWLSGTATWVLEGCARGIGGEQATALLIPQTSQHSCRTAKISGFFALAAIKDIYNADDIDEA